MKHLLLILFFATPFLSTAQKVGDTDLSTLPDVKYIKLNIGSIINVKKKAYDYSIVIDTGVDSNGWPYKDGQPYEPKSEMEAVNFIASFGWEIVSESYLAPPPGAVTMWAVVMKRK